MFREPATGAAAALVLVLVDLIGGDAEATP